MRSDVAEPDLNDARRKADKLHLGTFERTILLCVDRKEAGCASAKEMTASWKFLKRRLKERGLAGRGGVLRLKMGCCGVCRGGPIAAVMPDGVWYGRCNPNVLEEVIEQHLIGGREVSRYVIARDPRRLEPLA